MTQDTLQKLLVQYAKQPSPDLLESLTEGFIGIPKAIAAKFTGHGIEYDDLLQVGSIALMKAIQRFDPGMGYKFITYATPTIVGDLRNFIRDKSNLIKASRSTKNLLYNMNKVKDHFVQENYREPNLQELAELMQVDKNELMEALLAQNSTNVSSLDASIDDESSDSLSAFIGYEEQGYINIENEGLMEWIKSHTSSQEFQLLQYRFMHNLSQRDTAKLLKVSQMQVSRLEKRIFLRLREHINEIQ
ncbi:MAG: sigma-70 family RNA polymerase sigma factor [Eubacteriales bacterium]|nr:sigma-70 family RNA polymerase sigma factor [Eubacteriales bacterium]